MGLIVHCRKHPRYKAERAPKKCESCHVLYILRHQHTPEAEKHLGGLNPYQFLNDIDEACGYLEVDLELEIQSSPEEEHGRF